MVNRGRAVSTPPSAKPQAQTAVETGCSLLSTHMGQWGKGVRSSLAKAMGPTDIILDITLLFGSAPVQPGTRAKGLMIGVAPGHKMGTEGLGRGLNLIGAE